MSDSLNQGIDFDLVPYVNALTFVLNESRKAEVRGDNPMLVEVGKMINALFLWKKYDAAGDFEQAEKYLKMIPLFV